MKITEKHPKLVEVVWCIGGVIVFGSLVVIFAFAPKSQTNLPLDVVPAYRTVEPGNGGFLIIDGAQYFIFDTSGHRYPVSRDTFDSYKDLPRQ